MSTTTTPILNKKITEQKLPEKEQVPKFNLPPKHLEVVKNTFTLFSDAKMRRDQRFEYFDARALVDYIDDGVRRFVTNINERDSLEDWQARVHVPMTRNKIIAILGRIINILPKSEFFGRFNPDMIRGRILTDWVDYANDIDDDDELKFYLALEAITKGTAIGYEGYEEQVRAIRDIEEYRDGVELKIKDGKKINRKLHGFVVPLEDFYPSSVGIRKLKDMPYCFWRTIMPVTQFRMKFAQYPNAEFVVGMHTVEQNEARPFYLDYVSDDIREGNVELIRYYNQDTDEYILIANGIWLNPLKGDVVMPLPFKHKKLPFYSFIFSPLGQDFFYGKSKSDELMGMNDVLDVLNNMSLDQSFLSIFAPILVGGTDDIEDDFLRPGRRIPVNDPSNYKQLEIKSPTGWHQFILQWTKRIMEETSVDAVTGGTAGAGSRTTATEIERAAQGALSIVGMFGTFIKWGIKDKDRLRGANALQFYPSTPLSEQILGEGGSKEVKKVFNAFKFEDTVLTSGKRGMKLIEVYRSEEELPAREEIQNRAKLEELKIGRKFEIVAITPEYVRNFEFDIKLVPNPKAEMSKALQRALVLEEAKTYLTLMPDIVDREELAVQIAEAFDRDPTRILRKDLFERPPAVPQPPQLSPAGEGGGNIANQMIAGATGGPQEGLALRDLLAQAQTE